MGSLHFVVPKETLLQIKDKKQRSVKEGSPMGEELAALKNRELHGLMNCKTSKPTWFIFAYELTKATILQCL